MEHIISNELKIRGYNMDIGVVAINDSSGKGHGSLTVEIDFVCNKVFRHSYIQTIYAIPDQAKMTQ